MQDEGHQEKRKGTPVFTSNVMTTSIQVYYMAPNLDSFKEIFTPKHNLVLLHCSA